MAYTTYIPDISGTVTSNSQALSAIEAKLDGESGLIYAVNLLESKVDRYEPKINEIYSYQPDIYAVLQGNSQALSALEAKLDGESGLSSAVASLESKLDVIGPNIDDILAYSTYIPDISGTVTSNSEALSAIEGKIDGDVSPGIADIKSSISTLGFKADQAELKLLDVLLRDNQECLAPMAYTPVEYNPHGKLEEVKKFVYQTLTDLVNMGYLIYDSRSWSEYNAGVAAYNAGNWYDAGYHFWHAYVYARCDAHPPGGQ